MIKLSFCVKNTKHLLLELGLVVHPIIPVPRRTRQKLHNFKAKLGMQSEFNVSLSNFSETPSPNKK